VLREHRGRVVLVVSHVTPIKLMVAAGLDVDDAVVHRLFLGAASLTTVAWSTDGRHSVRLVNDVSHLA
jgi:ribonuclease H / adenosylcobalamin/alpha-ribazole phosphatase